MGPLIRSILHFVEAEYSIDKEVAYASGRTPEELHWWLNDKVNLRGEFKNQFSLAVECDYSMFDSTITKPCLDFMYEFYQRIFHDSGVLVDQKLFNYVWSVLERPHGYVGGVEYSSPPCNASGRDDTSLINFIMNQVVLRLSLVSAMKGVSLEDLLDSPNADREFGNFIRAIFLGDDSLALIKDPINLKLFSSLVQRFGFKATVKIHEVAWRMVFLAHRPMPSMKDGVSTLVWAPVLGRLLYKAFATTKPLSRAIPILRGLMKNWLNDYSDNPIILSFAIRYLSQTRGPIEYPEIEKHKLKFSLIGKSIHSEFYDYIRFVYGCTREEVEDLVRTIRVAPIPCMFQHPVIDRILLTDDL